MSTTKALTTVAIFLASTWNSFGQINPDSVEITMTHVRGPVYMITGEGGNIGVSVGDDGVFVIDDQYAPLVPKILDEIAEVSAGPIRFVINTHWHPDHTGGNELLAEEQGSEIIAHENTRAHLSSDLEHPMFGLIPAASEGTWPVVTFPDEASLHLNDEEARLIHVPNAHTDGDILIWFTESNVLHTGDAFTTTGYPFIDWASGGTIAGVLEGYDLIYNLIDDETLIIPGHGTIAERSDVDLLRTRVQEITERIQNLIDNGMTEEEVVAAKPTAEWDATMGQGFVSAENVTRTIYHTLTNPVDHEHD